MKKLNTNHIDGLINKVITETLEEKANKLAHSIKSKIPTDDEIEDMMSSEVHEEMDEEKEVCQECGGMMNEGECTECGYKNMYESDNIGKLKNAPTEFDYVAEDEDLSKEDDVEMMGADDDLDPLDRVNKFCDKNSQDYSEQACKYHKGLNMELTEKLYGKQNKIDVAEPKGKITKADFQKLRSMKSGKKDEEMEGNAFTEKLKQTPKGSKFKLGDKEYTDTSDLEESKVCPICGMKNCKCKHKEKVTESKKFIQKATKKMEEKGSEGKFGAWCKRNGLASEEGEVTKKCIDKGLKSDNSSVVKMANFAKNIGGYSGAKHKKKSVKLTESEMISLIEKIVNEEKESNIKLGTAKGFEKYKQVHKKDGKENKEALDATAKKMKDYLKDGSKGSYETNPDFFPKGNGELAKMSKKAYIPSGAVKDYVDNFTAAALENINYDEIHPNEEWVSDNIEGSSRTGNNPEWANTGKSDVNKKRNKIRKDNLLGKIKKKAYNKAPQPIVNDTSGEDEGSKIMAKLESTEPKKTKKINEEFDRMKSLIEYNRKTQ